MKQLFTVAPPEPTRQDHTLVIGEAWEWTVTFPPEVCDGRHGFALAVFIHSLGVVPWAQADVAVIDHNQVRLSFSAGKTALLPLRNRLWYELRTIDPDGDGHVWAHGRIDLMTPNEHAKSIRRVSYKITIPVPSRAR